MPPGRPAAGSSGPQNAIYGAALVVVAVAMAYDGLKRIRQGMGR